MQVILDWSGAASDVSGNSLSNDNLLSKQPTNTDYILKWLVYDLLHWQIYKMEL